MGRPDQFYLPPPPDRGSAEYSADVNQSKTLGKRDSKVRTPEQTEIALFWSNTGVGTYGSAGHFTRVAQSIADQNKLSDADEARLLALVGIALTDSAISSVYWKIQYKTKRPVDLIRAGDPEAKLVADVDWKPLSPEIFFDYPSTLSTYAGVRYVVLPPDNWLVRNRAGSARIDTAFGATLALCVRMEGFHRDASPI